MRRFNPVLLAMALWCCLGTECNPQRLDPRPSTEMRTLALSRRLEVRQNFQALYIAEQAFAASNYTFCGIFEDLGSGPIKARYYAYFLPGNSIQPADVNYEIPRELNLTPFVGEDRFLVVAVGNLDSDPTLDVWTLDQDNRIVNVVDDLAD